VAAAMQRDNQRSTMARQKRCHMGSWPMQCERAKFEIRLDECACRVDGTLEAKFREWPVKKIREGRGIPRLNTESIGSNGSSPVVAHQLAARTRLVAPGREAAATDNSAGRDLRSPGVTKENAASDSGNYAGYH
jgi:hypothetical protein